MATYPIKMMIDESGQPFVPLTSLDAVIGEKNLQYIIDATETSAGHFSIIIKDVTLDKLKDTVVVVRWPQISSTVKPSYLQLNEENEIILYNGTGTEYLDLEEASNTVNILAYDGEKWILTSGAGSGSGHVITDGSGNTMEQQKVLNFVGFNVENDAANRATKIVNPTPINNLTTTETGQGSLDAYQGYVLAGRTIPTGGSTGQVLAKKSESDYQVEWVDKDGEDVVSSDGSITEIIGLTYEEYKALEAAGELKATTQYYITDLNSGDISFITEDEINEKIASAIQYKLDVSSNIKNVDLNDYTDNGFYYCNTCANRPPSNINGYLFVQFAGDGYSYQRYTDYDTGSTHERSLVAGEWQDWKEIVYDSGWQNLTLENGWLAYEGQNPPQIRRVGNFVQLRGLLLADANTSSRYGAIIPEDCRPTIVNNLYFNMVVANNNDDTKRCEMVQMTVQSRGELLMFGSYKDGDWFGLENISWFIN